MLDAALELAARGWRILPLKPGAKVPLSRHGVHDATTDEAQIREWWARTPDANIGVACGVESGLVVIDIDTKEALETWHELCQGESFGLVSRTGRGWQVWFLHPGGKVSCSASKVAAGIDVRGDGGYVVAPPSVHPSGKVYLWRQGPADPAPCPDWLVLLLRPPEQTRKPTQRHSAPRGLSYCETALEREADAVASASQGTRNQTLNAAAFSLGQLVAGGALAQSDVETALTTAAESVGLGAAETRATIASGLRAGSNHPRVPPEPRGHSYTREDDDLPPPPEDDDAPPEVADEPPPWRDMLVCTINKKTGEVKITGAAANALVMVRHHPALAGRLALDVRTQRILWTAPPPWDEDADVDRLVRDSDADELLLWISQTEGASIARDHLWRAIVAEADRHPVDRFRDRIEATPWDNRPRLSAWLARYGDAPDSPYVRAVARAWLIAAVARTFEPGCQADPMLVLEGAQGVGKTSLLRALVGPVWHAEISLGVARDDLMLLHGPVICEWAELAGLSRADLESVKAVTSRRVDRLRLPYARCTIDLPRRCVLAATTNEADWASDRTGNRRYWPVRVGACDPQGAAVAREQLWAEALEAYRNGEQWWLDHSEEALAATEQADRLPDDPWASVVHEALSGRYRQREWITSTELLEYLNLPPVSRTSGAARRLAAILRDMSWAPGKAMIDDVQARVWRPLEGRTGTERPGTDAESAGPSQRPLYIVSKGSPSGTDGTDRSSERE